MWYKIICREVPMFYIECTLEQSRSFLKRKSEELGRTLSKKPVLKKPQALTLFGCSRVEKNGKVSFVSVYVAKTK